MATPFTTWAALYQAMLDRLADYAAGSSFITEEFSLDTGTNKRTFKFRSFDEFQQMIDFVRIQADAESGAAVHRTYAKQGGRG